MSLSDKIVVGAAVILTLVVGFLAIRYMVVVEQCSGTASTTWCAERYRKE